MEFGYFLFFVSQFHTKQEHSGTAAEQISDSSNIHLCGKYIPTQVFSFGIPLYFFAEIYI